MYEVAWEEFNRQNQIISKRKSFKTAAARDSFTDKLVEKNNFYRIVGYSDY